MSKALIIYGTTSGNTEWVVKSVSEGMKEIGLESEMVRAETAKVDMLNNFDLVVFASPTYGVGNLQEYFEPFFNEFKKLKYEGKKFAGIALGDSKNYDIFCGSADIIEAGVKGVGGVLVMPVFRIDGMVYGREQEWKTWGQTLAKVFLGK